VLQVIGAYVVGSAVVNTMIVDGALMIRRRWLMETEVVLEKRDCAGGCEAAEASRSGWNNQEHLHWSTKCEPNFENRGGAKLFIRH
jgi:hypothetical protein